MRLAKYIKELRGNRGWTQAELASKAGLTRSHISRLEEDRDQNPSQRTFEALARALGLSISELTRIVYGETMVKRQETSEEILERLRLAHPVSIPVYNEFPFHAGEPVEPAEYVYRAPTRRTRTGIEGYIVRGKCLDPKISDGDIIVVDREAAIDNGDIVAALINGQLVIGKLRKIADELYIENNEGRIKFDECQVAAPVIEVIRRLK